MFGCQYDVVVDYFGLFVMVNNGDGNNFVLYLFDNDNFDDLFYIDNVVKYMSLIFVGWQFGGLYGFGNVVGGFVNNCVYSVGVLYVNGLVSVGVVYLQFDCGGLMVGGVLLINDVLNFLVVWQCVMGVGGSYVFDWLMIGVVWMYVMFDEMVVLLLLGVLNVLCFDNYEINVCYVLMLVVLFVGVYMFIDGCYDDVIGSYWLKWYQVMLMVDYVLSKCIDVYVEIVYQYQFGVLMGVMFGFVNVMGVVVLLICMQVVVMVGIWYWF